MAHRILKCLKRFLENLWNSSIKLFQSFKSCIPYYPVIPWYIIRLTVSVVSYTTNVNYRKQIFIHCLSTIQAYLFILIYSAFCHLLILRYISSKSLSFYLGKIEVKYKVTDSERTENYTLIKKNRS
jgi:hypothetical protein